MFNDWHCTLQSEYHKYHIMAEWMQFFGDNFIDCYETVSVSGALLCHSCPTQLGLFQISLIAWTMRSIHPWLTREITWTPRWHSPRVISKECTQSVSVTNTLKIFHHPINPMPWKPEPHLDVDPAHVFTIPGDNKPRLFSHHGYTATWKPNRKVHLHSQQ